MHEETEEQIEEKATPEPEPETTQAAQEPIDLDKALFDTF